MKECNSCKQTKELSEFFKDKTNKTDGHYSICKQCKTESTLKWRAQNRTDYLARFREYNKKHYNKLRLMRYGMTPDQHDQLFENQDGRCAICKKIPETKRPLVVDHNHRTNKARGLLCYNCNRGLHYLEDGDFMLKAWKYLGEHQ